MQTIYKFFSTAIILFFINNVQAQTNIFPTTGSAGIGTTTPNAYSILEMVSTTKGLLIPRMTKNQRDAISVTPPTGLLIFQTNSTPGFYYYDGSAWTAVTPKAKGWSLTGNTGINPAANFIGTTDAQPLIFKTNNIEQMHINTSGNVGIGINAPVQKLDVNGNINIAIGSGLYIGNFRTLHATGNSNIFAGSSSGASIGGGSGNSAFGVASMLYNVNGSYNTASGVYSLYYNDGQYNTVSGSYSMQLSSLGSYNTAFGAQTLRSSNGNNNSAVGFNALFSNSSGYSNTAIGTTALYLNTEGHNLVAVGDSALYNQGINSFGEYANTAIGSKSLYANTSGSFNTAAGSKALYANNVGSENTANGAYALSSNTYGFDNTATGIVALSSNTSGSFNTAAGGYALGSNASGSSNTAIGFHSLYSNTTGYSNTALGIAALFYNMAGKNSVAVGDSALYNNTANLITAVGSWAGKNNTSGIENTYWGANAGYTNSVGSFNNYLGLDAGQNATSSSNNFFGAEAGQSTVGGGANTFIGDLAGSGNIGGSFNTYIGSQAFGSASLNNATALGFNAQATASNQVMLGNTSVTSVKAAGSFVIYSDGRFKKNIKQNVPGLDFIKQLKPVTYNYDIHGLNKFIGVENISANRKTNNEAAKQNEAAINAKEKKIYTGFVAQDVEKAADKLGYDFSGVYKPQNDKDPYGLSYADFVVPLVKAVQELSSQNDSLKTITNVQQQINSNLQSQLDDLKNTVSQMKNAMSQCCSSFSSNMQSALSNQSLQKNIDANLNQNIPNPFSNTTTIGYTLPQQFSSAYIVVYDETGKTIKRINLSGTGKGSIIFSSPLRAAASYQYSLLVDGKLIDTKQMILAK